MRARLVEIMMAMTLPQSISRILKLVARLRWRTLVTAASSEPARCRIRISQSPLSKLVPPISCPYRGEIVEVGSICESIDIDRGPIGRLDAVSRYTGAAGHDAAWRSWRPVNLVRNIPAATSAGPA